MARELKEVVATHVSIVGKAANGTKFLLTKSEEGKQFFEINVNKFLVNKDSAEKIVYGIVYEPDTVDLQGDFMTEKTIEKMAHDFMENYQNIDKNHDYVSQVGKVLESSILFADTDYNGTIVKKGSWVLATKVIDDVWEQVQKGEFTGYSIGGYAKEVVENVEKSSKDKIFDFVKSVFSVQKDFNTELTNALNNNFWQVFSIFENAVTKDCWNSDLNNQEFKQKLLTSIQQMYEHVSGMTFESINKGVQMENEELKKQFEEMKVNLDKAITNFENLSKKVIDLEKAMTEPIDKIISFVEKQTEINTQIEKSFTDRASAIGTGAVPVTKNETKNIGMGFLAQ